MNKPIPDYSRFCTAHRVIDGDTIEVLVDLGFRRFSRERIRLAFIDAPEVHGATRADGDAATDFAKQWLATAEAAGPLILLSHKADSFGRWLGSLYHSTTGESLAEALMAAGHAVPYARP
jgi:micrococcal nuclease